MKTIKWLIQYDTYDSNENRVCGLSSLGLCDYKISLLTRKGYSVDIISPSITKDKLGFFNFKVKKLSNQVKLYLFPTFGYINRIGLIFSKIWTMFLLLWFLLFKVKKNEIIVVTHSLAFCMPLYIAKKIKGFKILLDFGEEYNKIKKGNFFYRYFEPKIIQISEKFIFCNDLMPQFYLKNSYTIIYGQYINSFSLQKSRLDDGKIHLVYAGIISKTEGSAYRAIQLAKFLDEKYMIHILGEISDEANIFLRLINENNIKNNCKIQYGGVKKGEAFFKELYRYDIGLNLRNTNKDYIDYAFPSKCLTYLCSELLVVSSDIKCIKESKLSKYISFYKKNSMEEAANVVKNINLNANYTIKNYLKNLDHLASIELVNLISEV